MPIDFFAARAIAISIVIQGGTKKEASSGASLCLISSSSKCNNYVQSSLHNRWATVQMWRQKLWQNVHQKRGADQAQKNPHGTQAVRVFDVWEKVRTSGPPEEAHQDPLCPGTILPDGSRRSYDCFPALSSATVSGRLLKGWKSTGILGNPGK